MTKRKMHKGIFRLFDGLRLLTPLWAACFLFFGTTKSFIAPDLDTRPAQHVIGIGAECLTSHVVQPGKSADNSVSPHLHFIARINTATPHIRLEDQSPEFGGDITLLPHHLVYTQTTSSRL